MIYFDGAFGTYYRDKTKQNSIPELANIHNLDLVKEIHNEYIKAGANAITTNTFAANSCFFNTKEDIELCIKNAYTAALKAACNNVKIFADIGYINGEYNNHLFSSKEEEYQYIASIFITLGANNFLFETFGEYEILKNVLKYIKQNNKDAYIAVTFAASQDGYTVEGYNFRRLINEIIEDNIANATGLNCICGPAHMYKLLNELDPSVFNKIDIIAMPNSGYPTRLNGDSIYENNAEYFSIKMCEIASLGVKILGGCCGTTPTHIYKMVDKLKSKEYRINELNFNIANRENEYTKTEKYNHFASKLKNKEKPIAVELDPPTDTNIEHILSSAKDLKHAGADIITLADSPLARTRTCSFILGAKVMREVNIEVMPHLTCRDRNNISISATLLGGAIEGIQNVLAVTGDPASHGSKGVFAFNSTRLIEYIGKMNSEHFKDKSYFIGAALNTSAVNFKNEIERAKKKTEAGVNFFMTQPIFSETNINNLFMAKESLKGCYILAGIYPIVSYKNAMFLNNEVSGIEIPEDIINLFNGKDKEEMRKISVSYALNIIDKVYDICDGLYIILPLKRTDLVIDIVESIKRRYSHDNNRWKIKQFYSFGSK